jgi:non-heme chloroperoxidase
MIRRLYQDVATVILLSAIPATASEIAYSTVEGYNRVPLVVAESGNPQGPAVLFIHGGSQGLLSWKRQLGDVELQRKFRLIALDLRGHGASGKPWEPHSYDPRAYGSDIDAVIKAKKMERAVIVSWSFGGQVTMAYIREYGTDAIAGLILVAASTALDGPVKLPPATDPGFAKRLDTFRRMLSSNVAVNLGASKEFVANLVARPLSSADTEETVALTMLMPAYARAAMFARLPDNSDLAGKVNVPALVIQGRDDALTPLEISLANQRNIKGSKLLVYEGVGHAPFLEDTVRFNRDIARFIAETTMPGNPEFHRDHSQAVW